MSESGRVRRTEDLLVASRFKVQRVSHRLRDGQMHEREVIEHPGAVVIIPELSDGRICLIKNYRVAVDQELIELPAGTLEPPEPPIETARRELLEETGFRCECIEPVADFFMSPGILNEHMHAFWASGLVAGPQQLEKGEQIENYIVTPDEISSMMDRGEIKDAKTLAALLLFQRRQRGR